MRLCFVVFIAFLALGLALPFLPDENKGNPNATVFATTICTVVFGFLSVLTWLTLKRLPYADVVVDDDGIWSMYLGKDKGLISWRRIHNVKERPYLQRLDLLDSNNNELLRIEYQLLRFELLRDVLNERTGSQNLEVHQSEFSKNSLYHLSYLMTVVGFTASVIYIGIGGDYPLGYGVIGVLVVFIIIYEYFVTATGIEITSDGFLVTYPFIKRKIQFVEIEDVVIIDEFHQGKRMPEVWVITKNTKKPFKLKELGVGSNILYKALKQAAKL